MDIDQEGGAADRGEDREERQGEARRGDSQDILAARSYGVASFAASLLPTKASAGVAPAEEVVQQATAYFDNRMAAADRPARRLARTGLKQVLVELQLTARRATARRPPKTRKAAARRTASPDRRDPAIALAATPCQ